ncbi:polyprotein 1a [Bellinger River virus]|uniref:Polyprotein 1a n=1 Tax=Bellinger River virus TaxID=2301728 RepID=A0A346I7I6_9NIDO|nr:polyprotein 1a [Bellinger River virus]AXP11706.1 polyprotein 1a [Bellinger River virus]
MVFLVPLRKTRNPKTIKSRRYSVLPTYFNKYGSNYIKRQVVYKTETTTQQPLTNVSQGNYSLLAGRFINRPKHQHQKQTATAGHATSVANYFETMPTKNTPSYAKVASEKYSALAQYDDITKSASAGTTMIKQRIIKQKASTESNKPTPTSVVSSEQYPTITTTSSYAAIAKKTATNYSAKTETTATTCSNNVSSGVIVKFGKIHESKPASTALNNYTNFSTTVINDCHLINATSKPCTTLTVHGFMQPHDFATPIQTRAVNYSSQALIEQLNEVAPSNNQCINTVRELLHAILSNCEITQEEYNIMKFTEITSLAGLKGILPRNFTLKPVNELTSICIIVHEHTTLPATHVELVIVEPNTSTVFKTTNNEINKDDFHQKAILQLVEIRPIVTKDTIIYTKTDSVRVADVFYNPEQPKQSTHVASHDYSKTRTIVDKTKKPPASSVINIASSDEQFRTKNNTTNQSQTKDVDDEILGTTSNVYSQLPDDSTRYFNGEYVQTQEGSIIRYNIKNSTSKKTIADIESKLATTKTKTEYEAVRGNKIFHRTITKAITAGITICAPLKPSETCTLSKQISRSHSDKCYGEIYSKLCQWCKNQLNHQTSGNSNENDKVRQLVHLQPCINCAIAITHHECKCQKNIGKTSLHNFHKISPLKSNEQYHHNHLALTNAIEVNRFRKICFCNEYPKFWDYPAYGTPKSNSGSSSDSSSKASIVAMLKDELRNSREQNKIMQQQMLQMQQTMMLMQQQFQQQFNNQEEQLRKQQAEELVKQEQIKKEQLRKQQAEELVKQEQIKKEQLRKQQAEELVKQEQIKKEQLRKQQAEELVKQEQIKKEQLRKQQAEELVKQEQIKKEQLRKQQANESANQSQTKLPKHLRTRTPKRNETQIHTKLNSNGAWLREFRAAINNHYTRQGTAICMAHYLRNQCNFGNNCRNVHISRDGKTGPKPTADQLEQLKCRQYEPCKAFIQNKCRFSLKSCHYIHKQFTTSECDRLLQDKRILFVPHIPKNFTYTIKFTDNINVLKEHNNIKAATSTVTNNVHHNTTSIITSYVHRNEQTLQQATTAKTATTNGQDNKVNATNSQNTVREQLYHKHAPTTLSNSSWETAIRHQEQAAANFNNDMLNTTNTESSTRNFEAEKAEILAKIRETELAISQAKAEKIKLARFKIIKLTSNTINTSEKELNSPTSFKANHENVPSCKLSTTSNDSRHSNTETNIERTTSSTESTSFTYHTSEPVQTSSVKPSGSITTPRNASTTSTVHSASNKSPSSSNISNISSISTNCSSTDNDSDFSELSDTDSDSDSYKNSSNLNTFINDFKALQINNNYVPGSFRHNMNRTSCHGFDSKCYLQYESKFTEMTPTANNLIFNSDFTFCHEKDGICYGYFSSTSSNRLFEGVKHPCFVIREPLRAVDCFLSKTKAAFISRSERLLDFPGMPNQFLAEYKILTPTECSDQAINLNDATVLDSVLVVYRYCQLVRGHGTFEQHINTLNDQREQALAADDTITVRNTTRKLHAAAVLMLRTIKAHASQGCVCEEIILRNAIVTDTNLSINHFNAQLAVKGISYMYFENESNVPIRYHLRYAVEICESLNILHRFDIRESKFAKIIEAYAFAIRRATSNHGIRLPVDVPDLKSIDDDKAFHFKNINYANCLGSGAYGAVYGSTCGQYVYKVQALEAAEREYQMLMKVQHLSVPQITDYGTDDKLGVGIIEMAMIKNIKTLYDIQPLNNQSLIERQDTLSNFIDHIDAALDSGIIQNDYHNGNVAIDYNTGELIILDWGLAVCTEDNYSIHDIREAAYTWVYNVAKELIVYSNTLYGDEETFFDTHDKNHLEFIEWFLDHHTFNRISDMFHNNVAPCKHHAPENFYANSDDLEIEFISDTVIRDNHEIVSNKSTTDTTSITINTSSIDPALSTHSSTNNDNKISLIEGLINSAHSNHAVTQSNNNELIQSTSLQQSTDTALTSTDKHSTPDTSSAIIDYAFQTYLVKIGIGKEITLNSHHNCTTCQDAERFLASHNHLTRTNSILDNLGNQLNSFAIVVTEGDHYGIYTSGSKYELFNNTEREYILQSTITAVFTTKPSKPRNESTTESSKVEPESTSTSRTDSTKDTDSANIQNENAVGSKVSLANEESAEHVVQQPERDSKEVISQDTESNNSEDSSNVEPGTTATSTDYSTVSSCNTLDEQIQAIKAELDNARRLNQRCKLKKNNKYKKQLNKAVNMLTQEHARLCKLKKLQLATESTVTKSTATIQPATIQLSQDTIVSSGTQSPAPVTTRSSPKNKTFKVLPVTAISTSNISSSTTATSSSTVDTINHSLPESDNSAIDWFDVTSPPKCKDTNSKQVTFSDEVTSYEISPRSNTDNSEYTTISSTSNTSPKQVLNGKLVSSSYIFESNIEVKTTTEPTTVKPGINRCFIHTANAALATTGRYLSNDTLTELYKAATNKQQDASELLMKAQIPIMTTCTCILHGTNDFTTPCCDSAIPQCTSSHVLIPADIAQKSVSYGCYKLTPTAHLIYKGNGHNGHWKCHYTTPDGSSRLNDNGVIYTKARNERAEYTLCHIELDNDYKTCNGTIRNTSNPIFISNDLCSLATSLFNQGQLIHNSDYELTIIRNHDIIHGMTPEAFSQYELQDHATVFISTNVNIDSELTKKLKAAKATTPGTTLVTDTKAANFEVTNNKKPAKVQAMQRQLRKNIETFCRSNLNTVPGTKTLIVGIGSGNDTPAYAAANNNSGITYDGCDIDTTALNTCQNRCPPNTKLFHCDVNSPDFDILADKYDLLVSNFSWHFKNVIKCGELSEFHFVPVYNPTSYHTWSKYYKVTVHEQSDTSITHTIEMPTCTTTEVLHTADWYRAQYCQLTNINTLKALFDSDNEHFDNFILIHHIGHKNTEQSVDSIDSSPDSTTTTSNTIETSTTTSTQNTEDIELPATSTTNNTRPASTSSAALTSDSITRTNIPITIHSCNAEDFESKHATEQVNCRAFLCREHCGSCLINVPKNAVIDNQLITNAQTYCNWSGVSLNNLDYNLIHTLHKRTIICLNHLEQAPAANDTNWVIRKTTEPAVKVLYMSHDIYSATDSTARLAISRNFDIVTHQLCKFVNKPIKELTIHCSTQTDAENLVQKLSNYNIPKVNICDFSIQSTRPVYYDSTDMEYKPLYKNRAEKSLWQQLKDHIFDMKQPYLIEWDKTSTTCDYSNRHIAIANFSDKHGLDNMQRLINDERCLFIDYKTTTDTNPDNLDDYFTTHSQNHRGSDMLYNAVYKLPATDLVDTKTVITTLLISAEGKSLYINGRKQTLPATTARKALTHIMQELHGKNVRLIGEVTTRFYNRNDTATTAFTALDTLALLPFAMFLLQPGIFTFIFALCLAFWFIFDRTVLKNLSTTAIQLFNTATSYEVTALSNIMRINNTALTRHFVQAFNALCILQTTIVTYNALTSNTDIINTNARPYHSYTQRFLAAIDYIPQLSEYVTALTVNEICGNNWLCHFGQPKNKLYLDNYSNYMTNNRNIVKDHILTILSFASPWGLCLYLLGFSASIQLALYNSAMVTVAGYCFFKKWFRCCKATGPYCPKHATCKSNSIQYYVDGKPYNIQFAKVSFCHCHNWWCNTSQEHILPHPIARVIEASTSVKHSAIKSDQYFNYVNTPAVGELPEDFNKYNTNDTYSTNKLSYNDWTTRAALFAYRTGKKVNISSHLASSLTSLKPEMTQATIDYFRSHEDWRSNYVASQQAGRRNIIHIGFLETLNEEELTDFQNFCSQYDQDYIKTCCKHDHFLDGKLPHEFSSNLILRTKYHTKTINIDSFAVEHHNDIKQQATAKHYLVSTSKPKRTISTKTYCSTTLAVLLIITLFRVFVRKYNKINTPAGLNPTGFDYCKGSLYIHDTVTATAVSIGNHANVQAWQYPNGTFAFTRKINTVTERTPCGSFSNHIFETEDYNANCQLYTPYAINLFKLSIYWFQANKPYTTQHGDYDSQTGAVCFGIAGDLFCHESLTTLTPTAFIWITTCMVMLFIFMVYLYIKFRGYFGNYASAIIVLIFVHGCTVIIYMLQPMFALVFVLVILASPWHRFVLWSYSFVICSMFFGLNLVILFILYIIFFAVAFWLARGTTGDVVYTPTGVVFSSDFTGIAKNAFLLTPELVPTILSVTGMTYEKLLAMSTGPQLKPDTALANAILKCSISNTTILYEPPKCTKLPVYLQSKLNRLSDIVINKAQLTNVCSINDSTGQIGHGIFMTPTTVMTARHCNVPDLTVSYRNQSLKAKSIETIGFNIIITVDSQDEIKPIATDNHHELRLGEQYTHIISPLDDTSIVSVHQLYPTPSGHFAYASTIAGESGSPIFYHNTLIGIHQAMIKNTDSNSGHALATRLDGTPFDPKFHDTLMTASKICFDGNALFNYFLQHECTNSSTNKAFSSQINEINNILSTTNHISQINDFELMQHDAVDLSKLISFVSHSPIVREHHCKPYKATAVSTLQRKTSHQVLVHCTLSNIIGFAMTVTHLLFNAIYGTITIRTYLDIILAGMLLSTIFRSRHVIFLLTAGAYFVNMLNTFLLVCESNITVFSQIFNTNNFQDLHLLQTIARFGLQDFILVTIIISVMCLKAFILPVRSFIFAAAFWTIAYLTVTIDSYVIALFIFSFANASSWFTCLTLLLQATPYYPIWFTANIILSLRLSFPNWVINRYHQLTSDTIKVNRAYFCHHLAVYQKPPTYLSSLISQLFYDQGDTIEFIPQSKITPYAVVGATTHFPNVNAKSASLMTSPDSEQLYAHFISAVETVLQSKNSADQQQFLSWCATVCDESQLDQWLNDNPATDDKLTVKRRNIVTARINFLKAKEEKLRKQLNLMQLEQVRGLMRNEQAIKLCDLLNRAVSELQEKASLRTKSFGAGIIAASTYTVPEMLVITNIAGRNQITWDDEAEAFCFEFEDNLYYINELNTNANKPIHSEAELTALTAEAFPLYGKLQQDNSQTTSNQANIGFTIKPHQIEIINTPTGVRIEYAQTSDKFKKPLLEQVTEATDESILLSIDGQLLPFKASAHVPAPVLAAIMAKLRLASASLQSIRLGGLENAVEHSAHNDLPLRTVGFTTYYGPSLCKYCRLNIEHNCKVGQFVQIPQHEDPTDYLEHHKACHHNKFTCTECKPQAENQRNNALKDRLKAIRQQAKNSSHPQ